MGVTCDEGMIPNDHTLLLDHGALKLLSAFFGQTRARKSVASSGHAVALVQLQSSLDGQFSVSKSVTETVEGHPNLSKPVFEALRFEFPVKNDP